MDKNNHRLALNIIIATQTVKKTAVIVGFFFFDRRQTYIMF